MEETITISKKEYEGLCQNSMKLDALEANGVDNWEGYDDAMVIYRQLKNGTIESADDADPF